MSDTRTDAKKALLDAARKAQQQSYSPYSSFPVGAAILAEDNNTYSGCNIENIAYPLGQCAEASAIGMMVVSGARQIREIMIASPNNAPCPPCGGCRQKLKEFGSADTQVHMATRDGNVTSISLGELLPMAFNSIETADQP